MKTFYFLIFILVHSIAFALPVGNPGEMLLLSGGRHSSFLKCDFPFTMRIGYSYDQVFDRKLRVVNSGPSNTVNRTRIRTDAVLMIVNFGKRVELFSRLGVSALDIRTSPQNVFPGANLAAGLEFFDLAPRFSWNVGARATLINFCNYTLGLEGQYFETFLPIMSLHPDSQVFTYSEASLRYREYQLAAVMSRCIKFCDFLWIPFLGVKCARAIASFTATPVITRSFIPRFQNTESLGWVIGLTWIADNKVSLTLVGRFRDEKAFHLNGQLRF